MIEWGMRNLVELKGDVWRLGDVVCLVEVVVAEVG
jgi:hypothetical protein